MINHSYEVTGNTLTEKVTGMNGAFDRKAVVLPPKEKAVSKETAAKEYLKQHPLELDYLWPAQNSPAPYLVYTEADFSCSIYCHMVFLGHSNTEG